MSRVLAGRFALDRELGSGGMARVFLGCDEVLDRSVAVKVLKPEGDDTETGERFRREGRTAARLSHPNIVQVYDAGEGDLEGQSISYIVMEYVSGGDLKELIDEKGSLDGEELSRLGAGICAGLAHAHEKGVIHRDVKPHNILLDETGRPKLTDFGIARALDVQGFTQTGYYLGTALYSSPEQLRGGEVTPKSDIYSLGAALYQAATGRTPFSGTPIEVATQQVSEHPISPGAYNPSLGEDLAALIMSCLEKDPERRPDAYTLGDELLAIGESAGAEAYSVPTTPPTRRGFQSIPPGQQATQPAAAGAGRTKRRRSPVLAVAAVVLLLALGAGAAFSLSDQNSTGNDGNRTPQSQQDAASDSNSGNQSQDPPQQPVPSDGSSGDGSGVNAGDNNSGGNDSGGNSGGGAGNQPSGAGSGSGSQQGNPQAAPPEAPQDSPQADPAAEPGGSTPGEGVSGEPPQPPQPQQPPQGGAPESTLSGAAAAQTVRRLYSTAASGNYGESYGLLSRGFRRSTAPTQEAWSRQFGTLEQISFIRGPEAEVSGNTATVTGVTLAEHTNRTERNTVSWNLVNEGGEWRLYSLNVVRQERLRA